MNGGPYEHISDLPPTLQDVLPEEARHVYLEAYQKSWEAYDEEAGGEMDRKSVAHRDGWNAVRANYVKDESTGRWHKEGELPEEEEEEEDSGLVDTIKSAFE